MPRKKKLKKEILVLDDIMAKPWSKLQKRLYNLMDLSDNFQIHCSVFKDPKAHYRYWITIGKGETLKTIWEASVYFDACLSLGPGGLIAKYINCPRDRLIEQKDVETWYGLVPVLMKYDRRFTNKEGK